MARYGSWRVIESSQNGSMAAATEIQVGTLPSNNVRPDQLAANPQVLVNFRTPAHGAQRRIRVSQSKVAAFRIKQVDIEVFRKILEEPKTLVVEPDTLRRQIVGAHNGGVAPRSAAAKIALFQDRNVGDLVVAGQVISSREAVASSSDDHHVVAGLQPIRRAKHPRFVVLLA